MTAEAISDETVTDEDRPLATDEDCPFVIGEDGLARLGDEQARAWTGLLRAHRRLTRALEARLLDRHGLSLSALELLGRLAEADAQQRPRRIARLAEQAELSLSRTSRLLDALQRRGLVERQPCPDDSRASNVQLTPAGLRLARAAQADHLADVQRMFVAPLSPREVVVLAAVFDRLAPPVVPQEPQQPQEPPANSRASL
ncbi:MAG: MarR family winged helix-turn-helix transcriptional regulator [Solirubrobacteraceae bacterium]